MTKIVRRGDARASFNAALRRLTEHPDLDELRYAAGTGAFLAAATDDEGRPVLKARKVRLALLEAFGAADDTHPERQAADRIIARAFAEAKVQLAKVGAALAEEAARDARRADLLSLEQDRRAARREADRLERGERPALASMLLDSEALEHEPDPSPLIDGVLFEGSLAFLVGDSGVGKSAFAISMSLAVASGRKWLGRKASAGRVLYIAGEGGAGLPKRVRAERAAWGGEPDIAYLKAQLDLSDDATVDELEALNAAQDFALIVYDTLNRHAGDSEENSATAMGRIVRAIDRIARAGSRTTSLVLHHNGKGGDIRGSSALYASADTVLDLAGDADALTLKATKQKDAEGGAVGLFRLTAKPEHDSIIVEGTTASLKASGGIATARLDEAMQLFDRAFGGSPVTKAVWVSSLMESLGIGKTAAYEITRSLVMGGRLTESARGSSRVLEAAPPPATFPLTDKENPQ